MSYFKTIVAVILTSFSLTAFAMQGESNMNDKKILVIGYDYPQEKILKESTAKLHQNTKFSYHGQGHFDVELLGEKQKIIIPEISESFLDFDKNFMSVKLYLLPTSDWSTLTTSIRHINEMKDKLKPIKEIAIKTEEFDTSKLTENHFAKEASQIISKYELEHYKIFFTINKLNTPKEIHPRDQDYFQLVIRVDNKKI